MISDAENLHLDVLGRMLPLAGLSVLDVGCGNGWMTRYLRARGARSFGLECNASELAAARAADPGHADAYVEGVAQQLPFDDQVFDLIVFSYSLHHVPVTNMVTALTESRRVLKPGGHLYVLEPTPEGSMHAIDRLIDDEAEVRHEAQAALSEAKGFRLIASETYESVYVYAKLDDFLTDMIQVDPNRRQMAIENAEEIRATFERVGELDTSNRRSFHQPNSAQLFQKT